MGIDLTYYGLKFLAMTGLIWDLRAVPTKAYDTNQQLFSEELASRAKVSR